MKAAKQPEVRLVFDPVCGQLVDAASTQHYSDYRGERYYFCCERCRHAFESEPQRHVHAQDRGPYH